LLALQLLGSYHRPEKGLTAWKHEDKIPLFMSKKGTKCKTLEQNKKVLKITGRMFSIFCALSPDALERVKQG
jgi:hypothetical protein